MTTFTESISRNVSLLSKEEILATVEHALEIAREAPHRANGGVSSDCMTSKDFTDKDVVNTHGKQRRELWNSVFFSVISREDYDSHQPG